jgi:membrane-associated phospholipid phosphatase
MRRGSHRIRSRPGGPRVPDRRSGSVISLDSWWWPRRPTRVPGAWTAGLVACVGAALFGVSALLLKIGAVGWDLSLFRILNQIPAAAAPVLTPLSHLFLPAGIIAAVVLTVIYVMVRNQSVLPVAAGGLAAGAAWFLAYAAKAIADRPRPYEVMANVVLRQQPAHGTSFPSSHTAVTLAVAITLVPFLSRLLAAAGIGYAVLVGWSRMYLGVHYPLDVLAGAGIGMAVGGVILLVLGMLKRGVWDRQVSLPVGPQVESLDWWVAFVSGFRSRRGCPCRRGPGLPSARA